METLPTLPDNSIHALISQAIEKNVSVETLERLLDMAIKMKELTAKEMFCEALANFQAECPIIVKSKDGSVTKNGRVVFRYAPLDVIVKQVRNLIRQCGFTYTIDTQPGEKGVHVYVNVSHVKGHKETTHVFMPFVERTQVMTNAQVESATMSIAIRRGFCNAFGIITGEKDTDGQVEPITEEQIEKINNLLTIKGVKDWIIKRYKVEEANQLNTEQAEYIIETVEKKMGL